MTDLVFFRIGKAQAALSLEQVAGVHEPVVVSPLPGFPAALRGLATVRGRVVAVVDPLRLIGNAGTPGTVSTDAGDPAPAEAVLLLLDGRAHGVALQLAPPIRLGGDTRAAPLPGNSGLARLCRRACIAPDGRPAGVVDPERLLVALAPAANRRR